MSWRELEKIRGDLLEAREAQGQERDFSSYRNDPVGFIRNVLGEQSPGPWSAQIEIADTVRDNPLVVVRSCNSAGKDWLAARLALWWVFACDGFALVTGPTERQVREIVMGEVARAWHRAKDLPGELFTLALRIPGEEIQRGILAFTSSEASRLTGFHAPRVMAILTEAQGVPDFAFEAMFACATGEEDRILAVGNPLVPAGRFHDISTSETWRSIRISADQHPNVREGREVIPGGVSRAFVERIASEYGKGSGIYRSRVHGEFPDQGEESLIARSWLDAAADRHEAGAFNQEAQTEAVVAIDPARYGPDSTVLAVRRGPRLGRLAEWRGVSTMETVGKIEEELRKEYVRPNPQQAWEPEAWGMVVVDVVGLGAGVLDRLEEKGFRTHPYNGGTFGGKQAKFLNLRAESYWHLRTLLEEGKIALPRDPALFQELLALRWRPTSDGKVRMEAKIELKGRLGRSPDRADAVVMAFSTELFASSVEPFLWRV